MDDKEFSRELSEIRAQYLALVERISKLGPKVQGGIELVAETCHGGEFCHGGSNKTLTKEDLVARGETVR